ncbi:uncharacterized protein LOC132054707 isoform X3 [Lycium ferocissimum]|uniref:uncharacterized protein LOC132054707 isoform X3 n=1 Tax=Lycium ferocissimum TaxID=112874 RepID=UPI0028154C75|nr:uncharacterized protein LOC132054707 isoform X3 [Lycium ferocissimum]
MSTAVSQQISLFRSQIKNRRFDEGIFRVLESVLASIDLKSLDGVVSTLKQFMRHESLCIIEEIAEKSTEYKLLIVDFLVRFFNLIGDTEACEKALLCFEMNIVDDPANDFVIEKIKKLKDVAVTSASSKSVQAQTAEYFKNKNILENSQGSYISVEAKSSGSTLFRDGIRRRHRRQLDEYRHLKLDGITGDVPNTLVGLSANIIPSPAPKVKEEHI